MNGKKHFLFVLKQYEVLITSLLVIFAVIILGFLFLLPNFGKAQEIYQEQNVLRTRLENLDKKDKDLGKIDDQYYKITLPKINAVLPETKEYVSLFSTLDSLERESGVSITRTNFSLGSVSTNSAKLTKIAGLSAYPLPLSLSVIGGSSSVIKFMEGLNSLTGRIITLDQIEWTYKSLDIFEVTFVGNAYFYPYPQTIGSLYKPVPILDKKHEDLLARIAEIKQNVSAETEIGNVSVGKKNIFQ